MWDTETVNQFLREAADSPFGDIYNLPCLPGCAGLSWRASSGRTSICKRETERGRHPPTNSRKRPSPRKAEDEQVTTHIA